MRSGRLWWPLAVLLLLLLAGTTGSAVAVYTDSVSAAGNSFTTRASFGLTQLGGTAGCISDTGTSGACTDATLTLAAQGIAVSPDNKNVYVATPGASGNITVFNRDTTTGALTEASCISKAVVAGCTNEPLLNGLSGVVVDPTGSNVYVKDTSGIVFAYSRNSSTGALTALPGTSKCVSNTGNSGACTTAAVAALAGAGAQNIVMTSDGRFLYTAARSNNVISIFARDTATGVLTQAAGTGACISSTLAACTTGRVMTGLDSLALSHDDKFLYGAAIGGAAIDVFSVNATTGALTQLAGTSGCISATGNSGSCAVNAQLASPHSPLVSPDDKNVYLSNYVAGGTYLSFSRNTTTGELTSLSGTDGCTNLAGSAPCGAMRLMDKTNYSAISPDGENLYVTSNATGATGDGVAVLNRNPTTGVLSQRSGTPGCYQETGSSSCSDGTAMVGPINAAVSPDGKNVYVIGFSSKSVVVFQR